MSGTNAAQGANGYNPPNSISSEELDDLALDQIDNLDQDPDVTLSTPEQFKHQGNVRDRIKELSEKGKTAPGVNHQEVDSILNKALEFEDHNLEDRAWNEVDQAQALLDKNAPQETSSDSSPGERPGDTSYTLTGDTATYTKNPNPDLYAYFGDAIKTHDVKVPGAAKIHASSFDDQVEIQKNTPSPDQITVKVNKVNKSGQVTDSQTFLMDYKSLDSINIQGALTKNITVDGKPYFPGAVKKISVDGETKGEALKGMQYDSDGMTDIINALTDSNDNAGRASHLKGTIEAALNNKGSWSEVKKAISDLKKEDGNNTINLLIWSYVAKFGGYEAGFYAGGSSFDQAAGQSKTTQFLRLLPDDVKEALIDKASEEDTHLNVSIAGDGLNNGMAAFFYPFFVYPNATSMNVNNASGATGINYGGSGFIAATTQDTVNLIRGAINPSNPTYQSVDGGDDTSPTPSDSSSGNSSDSSDT